MGYIKRSLRKKSDTAFFVLWHRNSLLPRHNVHKFSCKCSKSTRKRAGWLSQPILGRAFHDSMLYQFHARFWVNTMWKPFYCFGSQNWHFLYMLIKLFLTRSILLIIPVYLIAKINISYFIFAMCPLPNPCWWGIRVWMLASYTNMDNSLLIRMTYQLLVKKGITSHMIWYGGSYMKTCMAHPHWRDIHHFMTFFISEVFLQRFVVITSQYQPSSPFFLSSIFVQYFFLTSFIMKKTFRWKSYLYHYREIFYE